MLDFAISIVFNQPTKAKGTRTKQQLVAYYLQKLSTIEKNYKIYNKELLAIVDILYIQKVYFKRVKHKFQILLDY